MKKEKFSGYWMAVMCFIFIFINMGALNSLGVFMPSLVRETGYTTAQISLMFTFAGVAAVVTGMTVTPIALRKLGEKNCMLISTVLTAAHALIYSFTDSLWVLYLGATIAGVSIGIGIYAACCAIIGHWFVKNRLMMLSIVSAGSGIGSAVMNMFSGAAIVAIGYRHTYQVLAAMVLVVGLVIWFAIRNRPENMGQKALGAGEITPTETPKAAPSTGLTFREALKTPSFYLIFLAGALGSIAWTGVNMYLVTLLSSNYGLGVNVATRYDAVLRVGVAVFLAVGGKIVEKRGIKFYVLLIGLALSSGLLTILLTGNTIITMPVLLVAVMIVLALGGTHGNANAQMLANSVFGHKDFTTIQAYLVAGANIGLATAALLAAPWIGEDGSTLGCFRLFFICSVLWLVLAFVGILLSPYLKKKKEKPNNGNRSV